MRLKPHELQLALADRGFVMRMFRIQSDNKLVEFAEAPFKAEHDESVLENWLEKNPKGILEDERGVLIIGRQVRTSLGGFIDLLGVDRHGDMVIIELKRDKTPRETVAQALVYASFIEGLDFAGLEGICRTYLNDETVYLTELHRHNFGLESNDAVAFNKDQRVVLVGQRITPEIKQTAQYLGSKGIRVTCVEFTYFQTEDGHDRLMSQETVVDGKSGKTTPSSTASKPIIDRSKFLGFCDENGKVVFSHLLDWTDDNKLHINWGSSGCSINVRINGTNVGFLWLTVSDSPLKQNIYVGLKDKRLVGKSAVPDDTVQDLWESGLSSGYFTSTEQYLRYQITRKPTDHELASLIDYCESITKAIQRYGLT